MTDPTPRDFLHAFGAAILEEGDHTRGCRGREYTCTCGYDDAVMAELKRLRGSSRRLAMLTSLIRRVLAPGDDSTTHVSAKYLHDLLTIVDADAPPSAAPEQLDARAIRRNAIEQAKHAAAQEAGVDYGDLIGEGARRQRQFTRDRLIELQNEMMDGGDVAELPDVRRVRHKKRGTEYEVIGTAELQTGVDLVDGSEMMVYRGEDGRLWVRPIDEFEDGRFEDVK